MIEIKKVTQLEMLKNFGADDGESIFAAEISGQTAAYCRYKLEGATVILLDLFAESNDITLAGGVVRAAVASCRGIAATVCCGRDGLLGQYMDDSGVFNKDGVAELEKVLAGSCGKTTK